jgi:hypothetical protein
MDTIHGDGLSPEFDAELVSRKRRLVDYWNAQSVSDESGGTTWDVLESLRTQVTDLLASGTPNDILKADRLTAKAEWYRWFSTGE